MGDRVHSKKCILNSKLYMGDRVHSKKCIFRIVYCIWAIEYIVRNVY